ncbi:MAG: heme o synthase [Thermoplasmata archaeon]
MYSHPTRFRHNRLSEVLSALLNLTKLRITILLVFVVFSSMAAASQGMMNANIVLLLVGVCALSAMGAGILNNYFDRDIDRTVGRTFHRAMAVDRIGESPTLALGLAFSFSSFALSFIFFGWLLTLLIFLGWMHYVLIYTLLLKRRTVLNIVLGGWVGAYAPLIGWSAMRPLELAPIMLALIIFLWTPIHFWSLAIAYAEEYKKTGVPMLPVRVGAKKTGKYILLNAAPLILVTTVPPLVDPLTFGTFYIIASILFAVGIATFSFSLYSNPSEQRSLTLFRWSNVLLFLLFLAVIGDAFIPL